MEVKHHWLDDIALAEEASRGQTWNGSRSCLSDVGGSAAHSPTSWPVFGNEHPRYAKRVLHLLEKMRMRQDHLCTSAFAVGEILAGPYKTGNKETARKIRDVLRPPFVEVIPFTLESADRNAEIRAIKGVSAADAIHLACAAQAAVDLFLTNDTASIGKVIPGIQFIAGIDSNIL